MRTLLRSHHPIRHVKSVHYAAKGIFHALLNEANFRIQLVITLVSSLLGIYYKITTTEWGLLIISLGSLLSAELLNTLVEEIFDHFIKEYHEGVRVIKDVAAGFVLLTALTTLAILYLIFGPHLLASYVNSR